MAAGLEISRFLSVILRLSAGGIQILRFDLAG